MIATERALQLIRELEHNAVVSGNKTLERRLADLTVWFWNNRKDLARDNLAARQEFGERTIWIMLEILALQTERIHDLEGRKTLFMPRGVSVRGDVRRFG